MNKSIIESVLKSNGFDFHYCGDDGYIINSNFYTAGIDERICIYLKHEKGIYTITDTGDMLFYLSVHNLWKEGFFEIIKVALKREGIDFIDDYLIEMSTNSIEEIPYLIRDVIKGCLIVTTIASINN